MKGNRLPAELVGDERYRLLVESVTDYALYLLDASGTVVSWNAGARRFKGYEADEIIGSNFSRFYTDADRARGLPQTALETAGREGRFESEGWRVRKDGTHFWTHVVIDPIFRPSGELIGYAKITRDLTERHRADLALRESEERFRLLVQGVTDYAIYMLDPEGMVTNWNSGAARIKQYTADEIVGQHFSRFYTEEDRAIDAPAQALATARREGRFEKEGWRVRKDGSRFWANVVIDPIRNEGGEVIGFAKVTRDITERLQTQQALAAAQEAFFQSQKMEAIGQLTGGVAHDFNNLLAAVLGGLELLKKRHSDDPKSMQLIKQSELGAKRGVALTQRMLAFARRQELKPEPVDVPSLIDGISELIKRTLGPAFVLELDLPDNLPPAQTDANQLELAVLNLAVNARDAMPDGGVIRIAAHECKPGEGDDDLPSSQDFICLAVIDSGIGMDAETLARATEPFFTTKGVGKGTGLGLSMVQGLAAQLGGSLRLVSEEGRGTKAELLLPVADAAPVGEVEPLASAPEAATVRPLRILVVDDDALILMNTVAMLEDLGHTVLDAMSGGVALEVLSREVVDLVITDQAMPRMKGTELIAAIRKYSPSLPVILATGYAELPGGAEKDLGRLAKPFSQSDLIQAILRVTQRKHER